MPKLTLRERMKRRKISRLLKEGKIPRGRTVLQMQEPFSTAKPNVLTMTASLRAKVFRKDGSIEDRGVVSRRLVTEAFTEYLVDSLQDSTSYPLDDFKYHDSGTGTTAEANDDTVLETPCGEARDAGTQTEGGSANVFQTAATHTYAGAFAITEHGLFSASANGTMADRSVFAAINVGIGDAILFTYELTINAET